MRANESGQGTVEFAIVFGVFIVVALALWTVYKLMSAGTPVDHAASSASHTITYFADLLLY